MKRTMCILLILALALSATALAAAPEVVSVTLTAGTAPIAENRHLKTYMGIPLAGRLSAVDPDGDKLTYQLVTSPRKGTVTVSGDGSFLYTPGENRRGRDTFSFTARDEIGNLSNVAVVTVIVTKQKTDIAYSDTADSSAAWAAQYLAEAGIYTGEKLGSRWFFHPQRLVTGAEFSAMCNALAENGIEMPDSGLDDTITAETASVLLDRAVNLTDVHAESEALQAMANVTACGLCDGIEEGIPLTMADAALMLARTGMLLEQR